MSRWIVANKILRTFYVPVFSVQPFPSLFLCVVVTQLQLDNLFYFVDLSDQSNVLDRKRRLTLGFVPY
eukprot:m.73680 g.73680  ORF g.73680 m.73680 type:complete len:68 (-) comp12372_c0_seq2:1565-1768(-)